MSKSGYLVILIWCLSCKIFAQQLPFQNFGVAKGLCQSQVLGITQDKQRHLWIGTFGGLDRFDGTSFKHFRKADGLNSSGITCLYTARNGNVWAGTFKGITCYDGLKLINYPIDKEKEDFYFSTITEDQTGTIWAFNFGKGVFMLAGNRFIKVLPALEKAIPTCLYCNTKGQLLVNFYKKGIYINENKRWKKFRDTPFLDSTEFITGLNNAGENYYAISSKSRLFKILNHNVIQRQAEIQGLSGICVDNRGDIWIGTVKGILVFNGYDLTPLAAYTASSGLSDNLVYCIYKDAEGNMWTGTDGDGLFEFSGGLFVKYDKTNGLPGNIVMGIAGDESNNVFLGTREGGLSKYSLNRKIFSTLNYSPQSNVGINCIGYDNNKNLLIATLDSKLLQFNGISFKELVLPKKGKPLINAIVASNEKTWITASDGCYYFDDDLIVKINGITETTISALPIDSGRALVGSIDGVYLVSANQTAKKLRVAELQDGEINCLKRFHDYIVVGTSDDGIYFWNMQSNKIYNCNSGNGLSDNQVFSIFVDSKQDIWIGTGTGIQKIYFNEMNQTFQVRKFSKVDGYENSENNLNAIAEDKAGSIWIGTTKGVYVFKNDTAIQNKIRPHVVIQEVQFPGFTVMPSNTNTISAWNHLPVSPTIAYNKNSISFSVKGIYLRDPESVTYSYELIGYDTTFSRPVRTPFFDYRNLEPGKYVFRVKAFTADGLESENIAEYPFSISMPFYKSNWFLLLIIVALILTGVFIQLLINRTNQLKKKQFEILRHQEQQQLRERTSEDFHDELGNKLTRISLLADILQKKVGQNDIEKSNIILQIKENAQALYSGTKDVIWSLSPGSDNLVEILTRIQHFGQELFQDSEIDFTVTGLQEIDPGIKLPVDYSRNIIMIFKELLNNSLRHSFASKINIAIENKGNGIFLISQKDNGIGYNQNTIMKGNGLKNIRRRAERMDAIIDFITAENEGTIAVFKIKLPSKGG